MLHVHNIKPVQLCAGLINYVFHVIMTTIHVPNMRLMCLFLILFSANS